MPRAKRTRSCLTRGAHRAQGVAHLVEMETIMPGQHAEHQAIALGSSLIVHRNPITILIGRLPPEAEVRRAQRGEKGQQLLGPRLVVPQASNPVVLVISEQGRLVLADGPAIAP